MRFDECRPGKDSARGAEPRRRDDNAPASVGDCGVAGHGPATPVSIRARRRTDGGRNRRFDRRARGRARRAARPGDLRAAPKRSAEPALVTDESLHEEAARDPEAWWLKLAGELDWFEQPTAGPRRLRDPRSTSGSRTARSTPPTTALDRHVEAGNGDRVAFHWRGEEGEERDDHLRRPAPRRPAARQRAARPRRRGRRRRRHLPADDPRGRRRDARLRADRRAAQRRLRRLLARRGEGADAVLRGEGADHRRLRPTQGQERRDQARRRRVPRRGALDRDRDRGPQHRRRRRDGRGPRPVSTTRRSRPPTRECPPAELDAEHPLFILYSSGSTAKPKGILHTTGGYLTGVAWTTKHVFDLKPEEDVFWCSADVGWVTGHSYIVYGPLLNGATSVMYEGAPDYPDKDIWWRAVRRATG